MKELKAKGLEFYGMQSIRVVFRDDFVWQIDDLNESRIFGDLIRIYLKGALSEEDYLNLGIQKSKKV